MSWCSPHLSLSSLTDFKSLTHLKTLGKWKMYKYKTTNKWVLAPGVHLCHLRIHQRSAPCPRLIPAQSPLADTCHHTQKILEFLSTVPSYFVFLLPGIHFLPSLFGHFKHYHLYQVFSHCVWFTCLYLQLQNSLNNLLSHFLQQNFYLSDTYLLDYLKVEI